MPTRSRRAGGSSGKLAETFKTFLTRREAISNDYIQGKPDSLIGISATSGPATFFPPNGKRIVGAAKVNAANRKGASAFDEGSAGRFEVLQSASSGNFGFWTGIQHANMAMKGAKNRVKMKLRITEVFRLERGRWKLVHRHADMGEPK